MRFQSVVVFAALSSLGAAQSNPYGALPKCSQDCFGNSFGSCAQLDFKCICSNTTLISNLSCCVFKTCNQQDQDTTIQLADKLCNAYQVQVPTSASCASGAASTSAATASGSSNSSATSGSPSVTSAASGAPSGNAAGASGSTGAAVPYATAYAGLGAAMGIAGLLIAL